MNKERHKIERQIVQTLITSPSFLKSCYDFIESKDFISQELSKIYKIILDLKNTNTAIDLFEINKTFKKLDYLINLSEEDTFYEIGQFYRKCMILKQYSIESQIDEKIIEYQRNKSFDSYTAVEELKTQLRLLTDIELSKDFDYPELHSKFNIEIEKRAKTGGLIKTYLSEFDKLFGGYDRGDLIVIAARPSQGKTALAISQFYEQNKRGINVNFYSFEMTLFTMMLRLFCIDRQLSLNDVRREIGFNQSLKKELIDFAQNTKDYKLIMEFKRMNDLTLINRIKNVKEKLNTDIVYIDYLDFIQHSDKSIKNEARQIGSITKNLKSVAVELDIPIVLLCQLNRETEITEKKNNKLAPPPPRLNHLRNSGEIEQDADMVVFIDRPEQNGYEQYCDGVSCINNAMLVVRKNRNGKIGNCKVAFNKLNVKFEDEKFNNDVFAKDRF